MNKQEIRTLWKGARTFWVVGFGLWLLKVLFQLRPEDWNVDTDLFVEMSMGQLAGDIITTAFMLTIFSAYCSLIATIKDEKENNAD